MPGMALRANPSDAHHPINLVGHYQTRARWLFNLIRYEPIAYAQHVKLHPINTCHADEPSQEAMFWLRRIILMSVPNVYRMLGVYDSESRLYILYKSNCLDAYHVCCRV